MKQPNKQQKGNESSHYYKVEITMQDGNIVPALLTHKEVLRAVARAAKNPEDI